MDRRTVLRGGLLGAGGLAIGGLAACAPGSPTAPPPPPPPPIDPGPFDCGVASGIHAPDAAVLWTRFAPGATTAVELDWQVALEPGFGTVVAAGSAVADPSTDGCAKVLVQGLAPATTHYYRFSVDGITGPVGRTRTLPPADSDPGRVRLGVASCQKYAAGYYTAWRELAGEDVDAVVHLGDYIYEKPDDGVRTDPILAIDLASYRAKYRLYRSDPHLQAAHAAHAFATVWDDHEFVNDVDRLMLAEEPERAAAAYRAWWEYQPVWPISGTRIHRRHRWGRLVDLTLLDTRQFRDPAIRDDEGESPELASTLELPGRIAHDPDRTILGAQQREWFLDGLGEAERDGVTWKLIGNQVMISGTRAIDLDEGWIRGLVGDVPTNAGIYANFDDWDGFLAERRDVTRFLGDEGISGVAFLTGDVHHFWQAPVLEDLDGAPRRVVAQEYVCGSISSTGFEDDAGPLAGAFEGVLRGIQPPLRWVDLQRRGYGLLDCTAERAELQFRAVDALRPDAGPARTMVRFQQRPTGADLVVSGP